MRAAIESRAMIEKQLAHLIGVGTSSTHERFTVVEVCVSPLCEKRLDLVKGRQRVGDLHCDSVDELAIKRSLRRIGVPTNAQ